MVVFVSLSSSTGVVSTGTSYAGSVGIVGPTGSQGDSGINQLGITAWTCATTTASLVFSPV